MLAEQLLELPLELTTRTKLETQGILSPLPDGVRETTSPDIALTLAARRNELPNPIERNVLGNGMALQPIKDILDRRTGGVLHGLSNV